MPHPATALATSGYDRFLEAVARRQLEQWLPAEPMTVLDISEQSESLLSVMATLGHTVVHAADSSMATARRAGVHLVVVEPGTVDWARTASVDLVVAEGARLSHTLATELTVEQLYRVLRPGGRLLVCVESLVAGLAQLAEHGRWAELADVPAADVVLIPEEDGNISRCFWPEELTAMLSAAGFQVEWVRPRALITAAAVAAVLDRRPADLASLVDTELAMSRQREGESIGNQLVASARRP